MRDQKTEFLEMLKSYSTPGSARAEQNVLIEVPINILPLLYSKISCTNKLGGCSFEERQLEIIVLRAMVDKKIQEREQ